MDLNWPEPIPAPNARSKHKCKKYIEKKIDYFSKNNADLKNTQIIILYCPCFIFIFSRNINRSV